MRHKQQSPLVQRYRGERFCKSVCSARYFQSVHCSFQMLAVTSVHARIHHVCSTYDCPWTIYTQTAGHSICRKWQVHRSKSSTCLCGCVYTALSIENIGVWSSLTGWRGERIGDADESWAPFNPQRKWKKHS